MEVLAFFLLLGGLLGAEVGIKYLRRLRFPPEVEHLWNPRSVRRMEALTLDLLEQWEEGQHGSRTPFRPRRGSRAEYKAALLLGSLEDALSGYSPAEGLQGALEDEVSHPILNGRLLVSPPRSMAYLDGYMFVGGIVDEFWSEHLRLLGNADCHDVIIEREGISEILPVESREERRIRAVGLLRDLVRDDREWLGAQESSEGRRGEVGERLVQSRRNRMEARAAAIAALT